MDTDKYRKEIRNWEKYFVKLQRTLLHFRGNLLKKLKLHSMIQLMFTSIFVKI